VTAQLEVVVVELATTVAKMVTLRRTARIPRKLLAVIVMLKVMSLRSAHFQETILASNAKTARKWATPRSVVKLFWSPMRMVVLAMERASEEMAGTALILVVMVMVLSLLLLLLAETTGVPQGSQPLEVVKAGNPLKLLLPDGKFLFVVSLLPICHFRGLEYGTGESFAFDRGRWGFAEIC
jgi:hypothetical protein